MEWFIQKTPSKGWSYRLKHKKKNSAANLQNPNHVSLLDAMVSPVEIFKTVASVSSSKLFDLALGQSVMGSSWTLPFSVVELCLSLLLPHRTV